MLDRVVMIRRQFALEMGLVVPTIRIRDNVQLSPQEYVVKIRGNRIASGELYLDHYLTMSHGIEEEALEGIQTVEPAFGLPAVWVTDEEKQRAELLGYTIVDPPSVLATHLTELLRKHAHELLRREETKQLIDSLKETSPSLVEELVSSLLSMGEIQKVLQNLLKENVSIRDLLTIFEALADYAVYTKDPKVLTEYVRQSLSRQITEQYAENGIIRVITAGASLEKAISEGIKQTEHGPYFSLDAEMSERIYGRLQEEIQRAVQVGMQPIFLTSPAIRMHLKQMVDKIAPSIPVLAYSELESEVEVQSIGVMNLYENQKVYS